MVRFGVQVKEEALDELAGHLAAFGLILRGGFQFRDSDAAPAGPSGAPAHAVLLVGHGGAGIWPHFEAWRAQQRPDAADPLDTWSRDVIGTVAARFGARAVSPSDRPFLPFQQWAMRAEGLRASPLGILMHPQYGLWHAYRGALLLEGGALADAVEEAGRQVQKPIHLCDLCVEKPCLKSCPVDAYSPAGFDHKACLGHVRGSSGNACRLAGCLDRRACPHGTAYRYPDTVQAFHMAAFARPHRQ